MTSLIDLWTLDLEKIKELLKRFDLNDAKTPLGKYILLSEYFASKEYFSLNERNDLLNKKFRQELIHPNMKMVYQKRIEYLKNYLKARQIRDEKMLYNDIENGKLIDPITTEPIKLNENNYIFLNRRCYSRSTIGKIIFEGDRKDPFTRKIISDEILTQFGVSISRNSNEFEELNNQTISRFQLSSHHQSQNNNSPFPYSSIVSSVNPVDNQVYTFITTFFSINSYTSIMRDNSDTVVFSTDNQISGDDEEVLTFYGIYFIE